MVNCDTIDNQGRMVPAVTEVAASNINPKSFRLRIGFVTMRLPFTPLLFITLSLEITAHIPRLRYRHS
jgi:hypothetical protein